MKITESRANDILRWHDDMAGDHTVLFEAMTAHRDAAALVRQLQAAEQAAWHAGLDAGREQARNNRLQGALPGTVTTAGTDPESGQPRMIVRTTEAALSDAPPMVYRRVRVVVEDAQ